jgi:C-terminal processing protease CtpA/Prc
MHSRSTGKLYYQCLELGISQFEPPHSSAEDIKRAAELLQLPTKATARVLDLTFKDPIAPATVATEPTKSSSSWAITIAKGAEGFGMQIGSRANVVSVEEGLPAYAAGLRAGDQILSVNGHLVCTQHEVAEALQRLKGSGERPGFAEPIQLTLRKDPGGDTIGRDPSANSSTDVPCFALRAGS